MEKLETGDKVKVLGQTVWHSPGLHPCSNVLYMSTFVSVIVRDFEVGKNYNANQMGGDERD